MAVATSRLPFHPPPPYVHRPPTLSRSDLGRSPPSTRRISSHYITERTAMGAVSECHQPSNVVNARQEFLQSGVTVLDESQK
jgi:hypothetical protein